jgi:hypothetical protein
MKLKKFLLRYFPPGIILEYVKNNGEPETKSIDLLNLTEEYSLFSSAPTLKNWSTTYYKRNL